MEEDEQQFDIGNQDHFDNAPEEWHDHLTAAILHKAGLGPHPGKYKGPAPEPPGEDAITEGDLQRAREEGEISSKKMRAAQTGGSELGPTEFAAQQQKQAGAMIQNQALQGAQQAAQAQAKETSPQAAPAPAGPQGVSIPYPAQKPSQKGFGAPTLGIPADGSTPPAAPGPEEE